MFKTYEFRLAIRSMFVDKGKNMKTDEKYESLLDERLNVMEVSMFLTWMNENTELTCIFFKSSSYNVEI